MIKVDENDPVGEVEPSFPYREVNIRRNVDMKEFYDLESEIGRGKFGTVYRCREKSTGLALAAKFVGIAKRQERRNVEKEVEIMRTLQHPRLIQLYDSLEFGNVMCVILELIEGGELFERVIDDDFILTEKACSVFMRQICEGVAFIHSKNILHLDLKPENIMCLTRTGNRIKIIDFGLARQFDPDKKLQILFGTPEFVAPEVVNFDAIGYGTDMWSLGVICYVLLSGLSPFMGDTDVETMANVTIAQYDFEDVAFDEISEDAKDFIRALLIKDKERRMSANDCLSHKWLRRKPLVRPADIGMTKDKLKSVVQRWSNQPSSPTKIIIVPHTEPHQPPVKENVPIKIEEFEDSKTKIILMQPEIFVESMKPVPTIKSVDKISTDVDKIQTDVDKSEVDKKTDSIKEKYLKDTPNLIIQPVEDKDKIKLKTTTKGNKNLGDLESPSPSKQPKVELKPVESKGLTHNQSLPKTISGNELKVTLANNIKDKNSVITNKMNDNVLVGETSKCNLKPSFSVPNFLNPVVQPAKKELNYSKILTQNVRPKIAGIVLGQSIQTKSESTNTTPTQEVSSNLAKENIPKVITHKIIIEGKSDKTNNKEVTNFPPGNKDAEQTIMIPAPFSKTITKSIPIPGSNFKNKNSDDTIQPTTLDKIERRASDFSCYLHDSESPNTAHFADEIKNLSARLLHMTSQHRSLDEDNNNTTNHPKNMFNDPIRQFLANHGVVTRRTKHRITNLNRDVPIGSPPPPSNFSYLVSHCPPSSSRLPWVKHFSPEIHSAPQSPRVSPCRYPEGTSREALKIGDTSTSASSSSSIDSLVNYFKTASEAQKRATPAK